MRHPAYLIIFEFMNINMQLSTKLPLLMAVIMSIVLFSSATACGGARLKRESVPGEFEIGLAAYYSDSLHGKKTASGEIYDKEGLTAAHRHLPFGTMVKVTNLRNRKSAKLRINDRGPVGDSKRIIDLSKKGAQTIDMLKEGVQEVRVEIISKPN